MTELAYCPYCRKQVQFDTRESQGGTELDGVMYEYLEKQAICRECGSTEAVYQPYIEEAGRAFNEAVRQARGLVSLEKVRNFPKKYRIGKRPLSLLLGWGEITYSRFVEGQVPSQEYSDMIERLYDDPTAYYRVLTQGKDRIADVAYRKSEQAVENILESSFSDATKIYEVADYFCELSGGDITPMMVQKLTYYAQGFSYVFLEAPLFDQQPKAWAAGPVYGQLWHEFKDRDLSARFRDTPCPSADSSPFSSDEEHLLSTVFDSFGRYSGIVLSHMTHIEEPWVKARKRAGANMGESCQEPITTKDIKQFFAKVSKKFGINSIDDLGLYANSAFQASVQNLRKA